MRVEDVEIIHAHAFEGLVATGNEVLAAAPLSIRAGPHAIACLAGNDEFVAGHVLDNVAAYDFCVSGWRSVVIR